MEESLYGLFSVFSIIYAIVLTILCFGPGIIFSIGSSVILLFCLTYLGLFNQNPETGIYVINEMFISEWIFHPMNFLSGPILASILTMSIKLQIMDNKGG